MFHASPARRASAAMLIGVLAGLPLAARAQVYKCAQANGAVTYQGTPCPTGAKPAARPSVAELNAQQARQPAPSAPYDDPYAGSVDARPHPVAPPLPAARPPEAPTRSQASTSSLVANVQARNKLENRQQAFNEAHKNDPTPARLANCATARNNVNVLNEQRPVYSYDDKGNHKYVEDKDRAAAMAEAQRQVSQNCN